MILLILLGGLAGLFFVLALAKSSVSVGVLVAACVAAIPALLALWHVASRVMRAKHPESSSFYLLLAEPDRITQVLERHITYQVSRAKVGSEYILNIAGGGRAGYCRLDAAGFDAIKAYLVAAAPQAFAPPPASEDAAGPAVTE